MYYRKEAGSILILLAVLCFALTPMPAGAASIEDLSFIDPYLDERKPDKLSIQFSENGNLILTEKNGKTLTVTYTVEGDIITARHGEQEEKIRIIDADTVMFEKGKRKLVRAPVYHNRKNASTADMLSGARFVLHKNGTAAISFGRHDNSVHLIDNTEGGSQNFSGRYTVAGSTITISTDDYGTIEAEIVDKDTLQVREHYLRREKSPEEGVYELLAESADLSDAPDLILEPSSPPKNLGGWFQRRSNVAKFRFTVEKSGFYTVTLRCSRKPAGNGLVRLSAGDASKQQVLMSIPSTGSWGKYTTVNATRLLFLPAGEATLQVMTGDSARGDHLMNLRSIKLRFGKAASED